MAVRPVKIMAIPARFSPLFSLLRHSKPWGMFYKYFILTIVNPLAAILKRRCGDCRHQQHGGV
jgi:hypothetical protein